MNRLESISNNFSKSQFNDGFGLLSDDVEWMIERLERYEKALKLAITHISGEGTTFSEREKVPVLFQLKEALKDEIT